MQSAPTDLAHPEDPADGLAAVVALRRLADRMEDAQVERALRDGWTWAQVAEALGVTRQAVHKKHARRLRMFERFVGEARRVTLQAHSVAAGLGASSVEAEHLLVSLAGTENAAGRRPARGRARLDGAPRDAIQRDFERVLARSGSTRAGSTSPSNCRRTKLGWGASAKQASSARSRRPSAAATARSAASTSCSASCAPSTARCRGCWRPRASTATS